ncbi:hypothetical protein GCM10009557_76340 [Virgisporangium ochraceum]|uniref:Ricin B lectin domain-containing protein n=1 Tax=Virgisporangium ochraceum TaxID=65505 RepID=A0A8J3ZVV0_9ACTN|nr:hypothetical protein Voc01_055080 [Virgisporangium ochraceum]
MLARFATAVVALVLAPSTIVQPARAAAPAEGVWLKNGSSSTLCLDGSVSQGVRMMRCNTASRYQQWAQIWIGLHSFELRNVGSDFRYCLDGSVSSGARLLPCNENDWQEWIEDESGNHLSNLAYGVRRSLDGSVSQGVRMNATSSSSLYQKWRFVVVR